MATGIADFGAIGRAFGNRNYTIYTAGGTITMSPTNGFGLAENGHVVRLRSAAYEVDLASLGSDGLGHSLTRLF